MRITQAVSMHWLRCIALVKSRSTRPSPPWSCSFQGDRESAQWQMRYRRRSQDSPLRMKWPLALRSICLLCMGIGRFCQESQPYDRGQRGCSSRTQSWVGMIQRDKWSESVPPHLERGSQGMNRCRMAVHHRVDRFRSGK